MPIKDNKDAVKYLESILRALDVMTVSGRQNCGVITAVCNDLDRVIKFLKEGDTDGNADN